ncbi:hypothetical protein C8F01DRAFT_1083306 [Mycena amicta]|nr:hypothetical protein C8F01DRAFT_1083306 [Mycena amicta]
MSEPSRLPTLVYVESLPDLTASTASAPGASAEASSAALPPPPSSHPLLALPTLDGSFHFNQFGARFWCDIGAEIELSAPAIDQRDCRKFSAPETAGPAGPLRNLIRSAGEVRRTRWHAVTAENISATSTPAASFVATDKGKAPKPAVAGPSMTLDPLLSGPGYDAISKPTTKNLRANMDIVANIAVTHDKDIAKIKKDMANMAKDGELPQAARCDQRQHSVHLFPHRRDTVTDLSSKMDMLLQYFSVQDTAVINGNGKRPRQDPAAAVPPPAVLAPPTLSIDTAMGTGNTAAQSFGAPVGAGASQPVGVYAPPAFLPQSFAPAPSAAFVPPVFNAPQATSAAFTFPTFTPPSANAHTLVPPGPSQD